MAETPNGNEPHRNEPARLNIEDDMRQSYLDYAMSVNIGRALPDVRDGLKPVHRRILYAMFREGLLSSRRYSKCAGVVGESRSLAHVTCAARKFQFRAAVIHRPLIACWVDPHGSSLIMSRSTPFEQVRRKPQCPFPVVTSLSER